MEPINEVEDAEAAPAAAAGTGASSAPRNAPVARTPSSPLSRMFRDISRNIISTLRFEHASAIVNHRKKMRTLLSFVPSAVFDEVLAADAAGRPLCPRRTTFDAAIVMPDLVRFTKLHHKYFDNQQATDALIEAGKQMDSPEGKLRQKEYLRRQQMRGGGPRAAGETFVFRGSMAKPDGGGPALDRRQRGVVSFANKEVLKWSDQNAGGGLGTEAVHQMLSTFFSEVIQAVVSGGGDVLRIAGDAIIVMFGGPNTPVEDAVGEACDTAPIGTVKATSLHFEYLILCK